jgi:phthalate 4,5-dioxygenase oxygenase subunit
MTKEDNELLTRVENGAPMGEMFRQHFWLPAYPSGALQAGGKPFRLRLLGSSYVLFRAHDGRVGCFDEHCPHRKASLALGRNEDNALRCIFHGWKFSVEGEVVEVPNLAGDQGQFCKSVKFNAYQVQERGGIIWVWLGKGSPPAFPRLPFTELPENQRAVTSQVVPVNWLAGVEATMDSSHVSHLHQSAVQMRGRREQQNMLVDKAPTLDYEPIGSGFRSVSRRNLPGDKVYARINHFVMPWYGVICPADVEGASTIFISVPIDDNTHRAWFVHMNLHRPLGMTHLSVSPDVTAWPPLPSGPPEDNWGQNRDLMARGHFTGFPEGVATEDFAIFMSQGPILDRTTEQLCSSDKELVRVRQHLLKSVHAFRQGERLPTADVTELDYGKIYSVAGILDAGTDWHTLVEAAEKRYVKQPSAGGVAAG